MEEIALQNLIAQNICKLKPGLTLLNKEQYIPNKHGTKGFIDLQMCIRDSPDAATPREGRRISVCKLLSAGKKEDGT